MQTNKYEDLFTSVQDIKNSESVNRVTDIVEFLRQQKEPVTCYEVGIAIFGERYNNKSAKKSLSRSIGSVMRHLKEAGYIRIDKIQGKPIIIESEEYIFIDDNDEPDVIEVTDAKGNKYKMQNPNFNWRIRTKKQSATKPIKQTIFPTISTYFWIAD